MKLLYPLPDREKKKIKEIAPDEKILFSLPDNLDGEGKYFPGYTVITEKKLITLTRGNVTQEYNINMLKSCRSSTLVGNGRLEACIRGRSRILARYTMEYVPGYSSLARAVDQLQSGLQPQFTGFDEQKYCEQCGRAYPEGARVCPACVGKLAVFRRLSSFLKPYILHLLIALFFFGCITALSLMIPQFYRILIDRYLVPQQRDLAYILLIVGGIGLAQLLNAALSILRGRTMAKVGNGLAKDLRAMVYIKIQALSLGYLATRKTGDLMNRVNNDTRVIQRFIEQAVSHGINHFFILAGVASLLFIADWKLALLVLLPLPLVVMFVRMGWNTIRRMYRKQWRFMDKVNSLLQDILSGIRVVKAFGKEKWEVERFRKGSLDVREITEKNEKIWASLTPILSFSMGIGTFLVLYYGGKLVLDRRLALGELVQFSEYARMLYTPLAWLGAIPKMFVEAMVASERVFEITDTEPEVRDRKHTRRQRIEGAVCFDKVTFGYRSHEPVLDSVSLKVKPGEMIGLVGPSGAGKSTLINLLLRLYDVDEGVIRIDGTDIRDISLQNLRSQLGVVLQETFLFSGSILDNIRYARPEANLTEIIQAARIAHAHDFIVHFSDGYDTKVGERGLKLSGGERQRIAIARAILHDPRILILDEATSSVDTETEEKIQAGLLHLIRNRTTFAIAHRLATLRHADRIVVIEEGKIAEEGAHRALMKKKGSYYSLVMAQRKMAHARGV